MVEPVLHLVPQLLLALGGRFDMQVTRWAQLASPPFQTERKELDRVAADTPTTLPDMPTTPTPPERWTTDFAVLQCSLSAFILSVSIQLSGSIAFDAH